MKLQNLSRNAGQIHCVVPFIASSFCSTSASDSIMEAMRSDYSGFSWWGLPKLRRGRFGIPG